jgi:ribose/xylose/arabinose/galactoside ABC-type transport system permease subunit
MTNNNFLLSKKFIYRNIMVIVLLVLGALVSMTSSQFLTYRNLTNIVFQMSTLGIMAVGMTFVIISKGIDLSIAGILALASVAAMQLQVYGYMATVVGAIAVGLVCGLINGFFIGKLKTSFVVVTLSTNLVFMSAALIASLGRNMTIRPEPVFRLLGNGYFLSLPVVFYVLIVVFVGMGIVMARTRFGRQLYATGLNERAARTAGIRTDLIILKSYAIQGLMVGIAVLVHVSRLSTVRVQLQPTYVFDTITIVVLGGTALSGGKGGLHKTVVGLLLFGLIQNSMGLMSIPFHYQQMIKGIVLVTALIVDEHMRRKELEI